MVIDFTDLMAWYGIVTATAVAIGLLHRTGAK